MLLLLLLISQYRRLFAYQFEKDTIAKFAQKENSSAGKQRYEWLNKSVLVLGLMCFAIFLSEGAMLDWSAVYLRDFKRVSPEFAGIGFASFSIAMAIMRLTGDSIVERLNNKLIVMSGCAIAITGLTLIILANWLPAVLLGFVLLGIGASNIVPIFFSEAGRIPGISSNTSISAITTMGYAGQLAGPALIGFIAQIYSLEIAFGTIAFLILIVAVVYNLKNKQ